MRRVPSALTLDSIPARVWVAFALVRALKWDSLLRPPWWHPAMGLFPAAITLAENGFDLLALLGMPGYEHGGPNGHSTSPVTLVVALVLSVTGGGPVAFAVLHLMNYAVTAAALVVLHRLVTPVLGRGTAALFCVVCLLHPVFSVQAGTMYLEMPLFLCAVCALAAWLDRRPGRAALWATLAVTIKETGLIVPASLAMAALVARGPLEGRLRRAALLVAGPSAWIVGTRLLRRAAAADSDDFEYVPSLDAVFGGMAQYVERFLFNVPDLLLLLAIFVVAFTMSIPRVWSALRGATPAGDDTPASPTTPTPATPGGPGEQEADRVLALVALPIVFFLLLFMVALPLVAGFSIVLPRYFTVILPFLLLWAGHAVMRLAGESARRAATVTFAGLGLLFAVNTNGALYPPDVDTEGPGNDHPLAERSNAYRRLQDLQLEAMRAVEALPDVPVFYGHHEHFLLRWPELGYVSGPLADGHDLWTESLVGLVTDREFPPCIYVLYNYPWLGGTEVLKLVRFADEHPVLDVQTVLELSEGRYRITLALIHRRGADCPS